MSDKKQHLIIMSIDALNYNDYNNIMSLPNFSSFIDKGAVVRNVTSIYPSVTYTCHTSIITGTFPNKHGIYSNEIINPKNPLHQEWYWYEKDIKVPSLFDYAKKANLKTASVLWPVMAGGPIDYNCPEIWSVTGDSYIKLYKTYGSKSLIPWIIKHSFKWKGKKQPYLDNFTENITKDIIRKKRPNLICSHLIGLDTIRHSHGVNSKYSEETLEIIDKRIGNIINATKKAGIYNNTTFILLGDHGSNDFNKVIEINTLFKNNGLITVDINNNILNWKAYASSCGGSVQIHLDKKDKNIRYKVEDLLKDFSNMDNSGIDSIYNKVQLMEKYNLNGDFEFMLEAKEGYIFRNSISKNVIYDSSIISNTKKADHGYEPSKNMNTILLAKGNKIKEKAFVKEASLVDGAPTFANILGLSMDKVDGRVIWEILK